MGKTRETLIHSELALVEKKKKTLGSWKFLLNLEREESGFYRVTLKPIRIVDFLKLVRLIGQSTSKLNQFSDESTHRWTDNLIKIEKETTFSLLFFLEEKNRMLRILLLRGCLACQTVVSINAYDHRYR